MIQKLRTRFLQIGMLAFFLVVVFLAGMMNLVYHWNNENQSDYVLSFLLENGGSFPRAIPNDSTFRQNFQAYSPETIYETRYFSVTIPSDGQNARADVSAIAAVSDEDAIAYAEDVLENGEDSGSLGIYKYRTAQTSTGTLIVFLDCNSTWHMERTFLRLSILISCVALMMVFALLCLFSGRALAPTVASIEQQKRFITDAGHELKTPLAIIQANTEIMEMTNGATEWTQSTKRQTARLNQLIQQMLTLSRLQEESESTDLRELDISALLAEEAAPFAALAQSKGKQMEAEIAPSIRGKASEKNLRQLVSILLDNAVKYADEGGTVRLRAFLQKRQLRLEVENPCAGADPAELSKIFARFYRSDQSRSRDTGGFGIGLSIAQAIAEGSHGQISAQVLPDELVRFTVRMPIE